MRGGREEGNREREGEEVGRGRETDLTHTRTPLSKGCPDLASFPGPTSQTIGKAGGGPGTFWHVTNVKFVTSIVHVT